MDVLVGQGTSKVCAAGRCEESLAPLTSQHGAVIVPIALDVRNAAHVDAAARLATEVSLLVNNAGIALEFGSEFGAIDLNAARDRIEVNVFGPLALTQAFSPILRANGGGPVVNIISLMAMGSFSVAVTNCASKAAMHSITQISRIALAAQRTRVIGVSNRSSALSPCSPAGRRDLIQFGAVPANDVADVAQPMIKHAIRAVSHRGLERATISVTADDHMLHLQHVHCVLKHRQQVHVGFPDLIADIAMHEHLTGHHAGQCFGRHSTVRAADPEKVWLLR